MGYERNPEALEVLSMFSRRVVLIGALAMTAAGSAPALAADPQAFDEKAFADAQKAGKPILVMITASWCPTCKAQQPILSDLTARPAFKDLAYFVVDFDDEKDVVRNFGARHQSTLIVFKGATEVGRSVGDTHRASIEALLDKALAG
jgi:thiol-disulfide isomerase/thioredoxin